MSNIIKLISVLCILCISTTFVVATGQDYQISGNEDFLINGYDKLPFKRHTLNYYPDYPTIDDDWKDYVNSFPPQEGIFRNPGSGLDRYHISWKCLSYATSTANDWFNIQYGIPMREYQSYLNGQTENGTNPRLLELMYHERGSHNKNSKFRGWASDTYYFVPAYFAEYTSKFSTILGDYCKSEAKSGLTEEQCEEINDQASRDPITNELISYNLKGFAEILKNPINYINEEDYNLPDSNLSYTSYDDLFNIGDYGYYSTGVTKFDRTQKDIDKLKTYLKKYGPLLAFTEEHDYLTDWNLWSYINIHSMAIIGYYIDGGETYFIAHDNYGTYGSQYKKLTIDEIDHVYYFYVKPNWPFFHHDLRRTGFTLLKGDLKSGQMESAGYYLWTDSSGYDKISVADVDGNGMQDVIVLTTYGGGKVTRLERDSDDPTAELEKKWEEIVGGTLGAAPSIDDIDNDSYKEIVFGVDEWGDDDDSCWIFALKHSGVWAWNPTYIENCNKDVVVDDTAIADLNNDGNKEIIFTTYSHLSSYQSELYVLDGETGNKIFNTPFNLSSSYGSPYAVSIADVQGDDKLEIIVPTVQGIYIYEFSGSGISSTPVCSNSHARITGSAVVSDIDRDNNYELIYTTTNTNCPSGSTCYDKIYVVDPSDCNAIDSFSISDGDPQVSPAVGNLDKSSDELEIVTTIMTDAGNTKGEVRAYSFVSDNLAQLWSFPGNGTTIILTQASPDIADINWFEGGLEVIFGGNDERLFVVNSSGHYQYDFDLGGQIASAPAIADWDGDGMAEILAKHLDNIAQIVTILENGTMIINFTTKATYSGVISILDNENKQPKLAEIEDIIIIANDLINLTPNATDYNNHTLTYSYSSPLNSSGHWQTNQNDTGNYSALVTVSDGNLSDSQYIDVMVLKESSLLRDNFSDGSKIKLVVFNETLTNVTYINMSNDSITLVSQFKLYGQPINTTNESYQEPDPNVINANEINVTGNYSSYIVDKNWNTYYSGGENTEAIVEIKNLTIPNNPKHILIHLRARVYGGGNGRFGIYHYNNEYYEIVTSTIPITNLSYKDYYFDIYEKNSQPLWKTNETNYRLEIDNINDYINNSNSIRWYYDYINDNWASQKIYESEVMFIQDSEYPTDINIKIANNTIKLPGGLHEDTFIQDKFTNGENSEQFNLTNNSIIRYIALPKDAEITKANIRTGTTLFFDYGKIMDDFENGNYQWDEYATTCGQGTCQTSVTSGLEDDAASASISIKYADDPSSAEAYFISNSSFDLRNVSWFEVTFTWGCSFSIWSGIGSASVNIQGMDEDNSTASFFSIYETGWDHSYSHPKQKVKFEKINSTHWNIYENGVLTGNVGTGLNPSQQWRIRLYVNANRVGTSNQYLATSGASFYKISYNDLNESKYTRLGYCYDWNGQVTGIENYEAGPYCADGRGWLKYDVDNDGRNESYMLTDQTYGYWFLCGCSHTEDVSSFEVNGSSYPCWDGNCDEQAEDILWEKTITIPGNITYPSVKCTCGPNIPGSITIGEGKLIRCFNDTYDYDANASNECNSLNDIREAYLALECTVDSECVDSKYCNTTSDDYSEYSCDTPICFPSCEDWEEETYSNHSCSCSLSSDRCYNATLQINSTHYCDENRYVREIKTTVLIDDTEVISTSNENLEVDVKTEIQNFLDECTPDQNRTCLVPVNITSNYNSSLDIVSIDINYKINKIDFTSEMGNYIRDFCEDNCSVPINFSSDTKGILNVSDLKVYYRYPSKSLNVYNFSVIYSNNTQKIFGFNIENDGDLSLDNNIAWYLESGDGNIINSTQNISLKPENNTHVEVGYNYTDSRYYNVSVTAFSDNITDSETLSIPIGDLIVRKLKELYYSRNNTVFGFNILNNDEDNLTNINWSLNTSESTIDSTQLINLTPSQEIFVFAKYHYNTTGQFTVNVTVNSGTLSDSDSISIKVRPLKVTNLIVLNSSGNKRIFGFIITNSLNVNLTDVNWTFDTKNNYLINSTQDIILTQDEDMFVYVEYNFTNSGTFNVSATAYNGTLSDSENITITV